MNFASAPNRRMAFERHSRMNHRISADYNVTVDISGGRILDRHSSGHQVGGLLLPHDSTHCREIGAAIDAANLVRIRDGHGFDPPAALTVNGDEVGKVILTLDVRCRDAADRLE